ncbi:MFS transporter [Roseomonas sp. CCTCC AB2023176]|uniref:MFS transporter n=1 Tax=Roseomonas sp. CCTCC AB2023176 TaxID=3342640 RepID=UPI0035DECD14
MDSTTQPPRTALRHAGLLAAVFLGVGVAMPFVPPFLASRGLTAGEVAVVLFAGSVIRFLAGPPLGRAADRLGDGRLLLIPCGLAAALAALLYLAADGFLALLILMAAFSLAIAPIVPLAEALWVAAAQRERLDYGRVRAAGSAAFILAALATGWLATRAGTEAVPPLLAGSYLAVVVAAWWLPRAAGPAPAARGGVFALHLFRVPGFTRLVVLSALIQGSHAAYYGFGSIHWLRAGHSADSIGLLWAEAVLVEVALFFWAGRLFAGWSPRALTLLAVGAVILRWTGTAATTDLAALLALQALHAVTFGAQHLAAMRWIAAHAPPGEALSMQSLHAALGGTASIALGTLAAGPLYAGSGAGVFLAAALMGFAALPVAWTWREGGVPDERSYDAGQPRITMAPCENTSTSLVVKSSRGSRAASTPPK